MTTYTTKRAAALAQRLAEQEAENQRRLAEIQAEQDAHEARLDKALADAGPARVALVEDLLDKLGIDPVPHEVQRHKRTGEVVTDKAGQPRLIDPDPNEEQRMRLLADAIDELLETAHNSTGDVPEVQSSDVLDDVVPDEATEDVDIVSTDAPESQRDWAAA